MDRIQNVTEKYAIVIAIVSAAIVLMVLSYAGRIFVESRAGAYSTNQSVQVGVLR